MDIRINIRFQFEESEYHADILIIKLSTSPLHYFYVVHLFDDGIISQFSRRYIFKTEKNKFLNVYAETKREGALIQSIQHAIINHKYHPVFTV